MRGEQRRQTLITRRSIVIGAATLPIASRAFARAVQSPATQEDERLMKLAISEAAQGDFPFGTVIVRDGEVLMSGRNLGIKEQDPTAHGEMVAIRRFLVKYGPENLKGTTHRKCLRNIVMGPSSTPYPTIPRNVATDASTFASAKSVRAMA